MITASGAPGRTLSSGRPDHWAGRRGGSHSRFRRSGDGVARARRPGGSGAHLLLRATRVLGLDSLCSWAGRAVPSIPLSGPSSFLLFFLFHFSSVFTQNRPLPPLCFQGKSSSSLLPLVPSPLSLLLSAFCAVLLAARAQHRPPPSTGAFFPSPSRHPVALTATSSARQPGFRRREHFHPLS